MKKRTSKDPVARDPLMVHSVEKAFRVLDLFDGHRPSLSLSQISDETGMGMSAAQRFTHTLAELGYLRKSSETRHYELTVKALEMGYRYTHSNTLLAQAMPFLLHLSKTTEETVNLTVPDGTEIVFVSRFMSRHVLNNDVVIGTRLPAYCTSPGRALLSGLADNELSELLGRSDLRPVTPYTIWNEAEVLDRVRAARRDGYATAFEEYFIGDLSVAAPIFGRAGRPTAAINIGVSRSRYTPEEAEEKFAPLVTAAAHSITLAYGQKR
ncbi:IclR family transcriptional regulator [Roseibium aggregatum]|uniref:Helix-turn-helix domain-containing protein n=1 Tax=Roseibium aggregatum TaxID=187304 RepID=A0A939EHU6_9HYPH|nr:IclR family transcriptional regulator C-terminal domain-containing protein [Roseibium aggregatum]MBN9672010.1 helix-turn-helix domain-containing protein [Roseibium aggregatum]